MRRYTDPVEVRQGPLDEEARGLGAQGAAEGPQQFLWRGRLWKVRAVLAHWVETGPWWSSPGVRAVIGSEGVAEPEAGPLPLGDLITERELWRVEAGRGRAVGAVGVVGPDGEPDTGGVFDLAF